MGQRDIRSSLANPETELLVRTAWESFAHSEEPVRNVRTAVAHSWRRCAEANVNLDLRRAPEPLAQRDFHQLQCQNTELIEASEQTIGLARELLAKSGAAMMLTDRYGVILNIVGDDRTLKVLENINMLPGACWTEENCGTNAIGTALSSGMPVQIHGSEHYCELIKRFTCSASIISDPLIAQVLGTINISGFAETYSPQSMVLVLNTAHRIKEALEYKLLSNKYKVLNQCDAQLASSFREDLLLLDYRGAPVKVGVQAKATLANLGVALDDPQPFSTIAAYSRKQSRSTESCLPQWLQADWIEPLFDNKEHIGSIIRLSSERVKRTVHSSVPNPEHLSAFSHAIGESKSFRQTVAKSCKIASSKASTLLLGETGAGKEIFANGIHRIATGDKAPFIALNCGALTRDLLASELFGYVDGAFTGARRGGMRGKIEAADGGTLFLDEIGEMPIDIQPIFLRVLEQREVLRLGDTSPRKVAFRLICATNRDLKKEIDLGKFRLDLFYRISVVSIKIPSLRERIGDPALLANHFLQHFCSLHQVPALEFSSDALEQLNIYPWPGNVRELRNIVECLALASPGPVISRAELETELRSETYVVEDHDTSHIVGNLARGEYEQIKRALQQAEGNATHAAKALGIAKSTLYLKVKKMRLGSFLDSQRSMNK